MMASNSDVCLYHEVLLGGLDELRDRLREACARISTLELLLREARTLIPSGGHSVACRERMQRYGPDFGCSCGEDEREQWERRAREALGEGGDHVLRDDLRGR